MSDRSRGETGIGWCTKAEMRNAAWWSVIRTDRIVELSPKLPIALLGGAAIDALDRRASRCTVTQWILDWPIFQEKIPRWEWPQWREKLQLIDVPIERFVAGGTLRQPMLDVGPHAEKARFPDKALPDEQIERSMHAGVEAGLAALAEQLRSEAQLAVRLADSVFVTKQTKADAMHR